MSNHFPGRRRQGKQIFPPKNLCIVTNPRAERNVTTRVALVVPEYRTDVGGRGGVASVADFLIESLGTDPSLSTDIISLRMSRNAKQSRRILAPSTWLRGVVSEVRRVGEVRVIDVGANLAEIESQRFRPRRALTSLLRQYTVTVVVAGTPAAAYPLKKLEAPVVLQVATLVDVERRGYVRHGKTRVDRATRW